MYSLSGEMTARALARAGFIPRATALLRPLLNVVVALVVLLTIAAAAADAAAATAPNILFVVYDDLRPQLSAFGHDGMKTPYFDSLAAESLVFHRAYTNYPYCAPSRNRYVQSTRALTCLVWHC